MKIMILANPPWVPTGYGVQMKLLIPRLIAAGHKVALTPISGHTGQIIEVAGLPVYPTFGDPLGQNVVAGNARHFGADIILSLTDMYMQRPELYESFPWVAYFPADHETMPPSVSEKLKKSFYPIAMSKFGQEQARGEGIEAAYVPHAVDTSAYFPQDKLQSRLTLGLPAQAFIIGMVAANKGVRKCFPEHLAAFKIFQEKHPDSVLYIHASNGRRGSDLESDLIGQAHFIGVKNVIFPDQFRYLLGYDDVAMRAVYNAMDVHCVVSVGEGFGVPQLEAQACGTPVICGNWTASPEICFDGWLVNKYTKIWTPQNAYQYLPGVGAISNSLESAHESILHRQRKFYKSPEDFAIIKEYDIENVFKNYWIPVLADIEEKLKTPRGVPGLEMMR